MISSFPTDIPIISVKIYLFVYISLTFWIFIKVKSSIIVTSDLHSIVFWKQSQPQTITLLCKLNPSTFLAHCLCPYKLCNLWVIWPDYVAYLHTVFEKCISIIFRSTFKVNEVGWRKYAGDQIWLFMCTHHIKILKWIGMFSIGWICLKNKRMVSLVNMF